MEETVLPRETGVRRRGRDIMVAIDHTQNSKHAFDWAIAHLCRLADTLHLLHVHPPKSGDFLCSSPKSSDDTAQSDSDLMDKLVAEAYEVAMVETQVKIVSSGDAARVIVDEATRLKPVAVVMGTHLRGLLQSMLKGGTSEYVFHHCPCPVVMVPPKELGDESVL